MNATALLKDPHTNDAYLLLHTLLFFKAHAKSNYSSLKYINGFDDPEIIAGAGTMGIEILEQVSSASLQTNQSTRHSNNLSSY